MGCSDAAPESPTKGRGLLVMRAAIVSTYPPRACGIGAFAADVRRALLGFEGIDRVEKVVIVNEPSRPQRPGLVATIAQGVRGDYVRAARILGRLDVDVVLLQHEYGIFGGRDGEYAASLTEELSQPLVVTLHTVLSAPTPHQAKVLAAVCRQRAARDRHDRHCARPARRRRHLRAGESARRAARSAARARPPGERARGQARARRPQARTVTADPSETFALSTFGLISAGKGIETVLARCRHHPAPSAGELPSIAGRTHPEVAHREGERYRLSLEQAVYDLGLGGSRDLRRPLPRRIDEIADLLAATDVFVTPYRDARADLVGRADLWPRRRLWRRVDPVPVRARTCSPRAPGRSCRSATRTPLRRRVSTTSRSPRRGGARRRGSPRSATAAAPGRPSPRRPRGPPRGDESSDAHATAARDDRPACASAATRSPAARSWTTSASSSTPPAVVPNRASGYCVDDVARLAVVALELARREDEQAGRRSSTARSRFSRTPRTRARHAERRWATTAAGSTTPTPATTSGARSGRLGEILATAWVPVPYVGPSGDKLLDAIVRTIPTHASLRTCAYTALGLAHLDPDRLDLVARSVPAAGARDAGGRVRVARRPGLAVVRGQLTLRRRPSAACADGGVSRSVGRTHADTG